MTAPKVTKIIYDWFAYGKTEHFKSAEVGKDNVVNIGLHENCSRATIYYENGTIIITNNVNQVFAIAKKSETMELG